MAGPRGVAICQDCARVAVEIADAAQPPPGDLVLTGIGTLVTNDPRRGGRLGIVEDAALAVRRGRITWVGPESHLPDRYRQLEEIPCGGRAVVPGLVDASNRLLAVPIDPVDDPVGLTLDRLERGLARGVTAVDLRVAGDPLLLAAARQVADRSPIRVSVTWVVDQPDSALAEAALAAVSAIELRGPAGFDLPDRTPVRLRGPHASPPRGSQVLSREGCPGEEGVDLVEAAWLIEGSVDPAADPLALASGSGDPIQMPGPHLAAAVAVMRGMDPLRALWAVTRGGGMAVGDREAGRLRPGDRADLVVVDSPDPTALLFDPDRVFSVVVDGSPVP